MFTEPIILRARGGVVGEDDFGNDIHGPDVESNALCWFEPRSSGEDVVAKEQRIDGYWVYLPLTESLSAVDAVVLPRVGTDEFQVVGEPGITPDGFIVQGYQKVAVERIRG